MSQIVFSALEQAFDSIDKDKTGALSKEGVREVLQCIGQNPTKSEIAECFKRYGK